MISSLDFYIRYAKSILDDLSIPYNNDCPIVIEKRFSSSKLGTCWKNKWHDGKQYNLLITLNPALFSNDNINDDIITQTIMHELIHTCEGCWCHTGMFTRYAERVNKRYHFNISRTTNATSFGVEMPHNYQVMCMGCGKIVQHSMKKTGLVKDAERCGCDKDTMYKHPACGCRKFKVIYNR